MTQPERKNKFKAQPIDKLEKEMQKDKIRIHFTPRVTQRLGEEYEYIVLEKGYNPMIPGRGIQSILEHPSVKNGTTIRNLDGTTYEGATLIYEPCTASIGAEGGACPVCDGRVSRALGGSETHNNRQLTSYITVLWLNPVDKNGDPIINKATGEPYKVMKQLLGLASGKNSNAPAIIDVLDQAFYEEKNGKPISSVYGVWIKLKRENDKLSAKIGKPVRFAPAEEGRLGKMFKRVPKNWLLEKFGHAALVDQNGKVYAEANSIIEPYDEFTLLDEEGICNKYKIPYNKPNQNQSPNSANNEFEDFDESFDDEPIASSTDTKVANNQAINTETQQGGTTGFDDFDDDIPF